MKSAPSLPGATRLARRAGTCVLLALAVGAAWFIVRAVRSPASYETPSRAIGADAREQDAHAAVMETSVGAVQSLDAQPPSSQEAPLAADTGTGAMSAGFFAGMPAGRTAPLTVTGRAVDEHGEGLAGVQILCKPDGISRLAVRETTGRPARDDDWPRTTTAADGSFRLETCRCLPRVGDPQSISQGRVGGGALIVLDAARHAAFVRWCDDAALRTADVGTLCVHAGARLSGRVVDENGTPLSGVRVQLDLLRDTALELDGLFGNLPERARSATTDAAGRYEFPHAWAASGRVQLVQPDWRHVGIDVPAWGEGSSVDAPDLVAVRGGVLAGIVRDDQGTPIAGAVVAPTSGFLDERSPDEDILAWLWLHDRESAALVRTDERGEFRIPGLGDETWRLFAGAPGFEPAGSAPARPGAPAMDFRLHPERPLLLRVVDGAGRRVPGAEASACWEAGHGGRGVLAVEAAPESSFLVHPQGAPLVAITVTAPGFAARQFLVQPARLASPELGVTLSAEARVDGRLVDDRGELVPDAWLEFLPARTDTPSGDGLPGRDVPGVGDDSSSRGAGRVVRVSGGRFSAGGLSAGAWTVDVAAAGLLPGPPTRLTLTEAQHLQDLLIRVPRCGEIRGQVHRADGTPVRAAPALLEGWITLTAVGAADGDDRQTVLGEDGSFLFGQLPAGSYVVDSGLGATTSVDVPAGGSVQVDLLVPRWPMVRGLVLDGDRPVAGAAIDPDPRGDGVQDVHVEGAVSDEHGRFTLVVHGTGTFALRAGTAAGGLSDEVVLDLQADRESTAELRLLPGRIDGLVTDADTGAPISGAHVALSAEASAWSDTTTDERGHFSIAGVQAGEHRVFASAAGWCADATAPLQLAGKGALTDVSLALRRGATVEVTVLGSHAEPVETVDVALWGSDPRSPGEIVVYRQGTSSAGEATFTDLGAGDMRIGILESGTWFFSWDPEEIAQAALDTMSLALEPGATRRVVLHLPTTH